MADMKHLKPTKLLWVDLEMTGLDPDDEHVIVEIAAKVTDFNFTKLAEYHALIKHPESVIDHASDWNKLHHGGTDGLYERARKDGRPEAEVQHEVARLIREQFGDEPAVLAGNSIHQDRRFIRKWWPQVEQLLHYRMLDVSAWKIIMRGKYDVSFITKENHLAEDDIQESIDELQYYLQWFAEHQPTLAA